MCLSYTNKFIEFWWACKYGLHEGYEGIKETCLLKAGESLVARDDLHVNSGFPDPAMNQKPETAHVHTPSIFPFMLEIHPHFTLHKPRLQSLWFKVHLTYKEEAIKCVAALVSAEGFWFVLPFNENQGHLKPPHTADTHTRWNLPAKSGGAAFGGVGGILLLAAQLGDSS